MHQGNEGSRVSALTNLKLPQLLSAACTNFRRTAKTRPPNTEAQMSRTEVRNDRRSCSNQCSAWKSDAVEKINEMINSELEAFYSYLSKVSMIDFTFDFYL